MKKRYKGYTFTFIKRDRDTEVTVSHPEALETSVSFTKESVVEAHEEAKAFVDFLLYRQQQRKERS